QLADFARQLDLSPARLMHVFAESTGTTWRAYLRWLRFQRAAGAIVRGVSLTQAAHCAGFHDSAHMTKTFKATYGLVPSQLLTGAKNTRPPSTEAAVPAASTVAGGDRME